MTTPTAAAPARKDRPTTVRGPRGRFAKGTAGRPAGVPDRRTVVDRQLLRAIAEKHLPRTLEKLFRSKSERIQFEAVRWLGERLLGRPRMSVEMTGGLDSLSSELARALAETRARRAGLDADQGVARLDTPPPGFPTPPPGLEVEGVVKAGTEGAE
jgi:hypothetical protein